MQAAKAYVLARLVPDEFGDFPVIRGVDIFSEPTPTAFGEGVWATILVITAPTFAEANEVAKAHVNKYWGWLLVGL